MRDPFNSFKIIMNVLILDGGGILLSVWRASKYYSDRQAKTSARGILIYFKQTERSGVSIIIFFSPVRALLAGRQMASAPCPQSASLRSTKPPSASLLATLCHFWHPPISSSPAHVSPRAKGWVQRSWSRKWSNSLTRTLSQPEESYWLVICSSVWLHKEIQLNTFPEET